ncbi:MAG: hypothetical protein P4L51_06320 [Puia sp.]|nr:hypothetical protein [Puia sp.]
MSGRPNLLNKWIPDCAEYINPHGVDISVINEKVYIGVYFPGFDVNSFFWVVLTRVFKSDYECMRRLKIKTKRDLDALCFDTLFKAYLDGIMKVECSMNEGMLLFEKRHSGVYAYDEMFRKYHKLDNEAITAQDFLNFTFNLFGERFYRIGN